MSKRVKLISMPGSTGRLSAHAGENYCVLESTLLLVCMSLYSGAPKTTGLRASSSSAPLGIVDEASAVSILITTIHGAVGELSRASEEAIGILRADMQVRTAMPVCTTTPTRTIMTALSSSSSLPPDILLPFLAPLVAH